MAPTSPHAHTPVNNGSPSFPLMSQVPFPSPLSIKDPVSYVTEKIFKVGIQFS